jgi:hypothetical protein
MKSTWVCKLIFRNFTRKAEKQNDQPKSVQYNQVPEYRRVFVWRIRSGLKPDGYRFCRFRWQAKYLQLQMIKIKTAREVVTVAVGNEAGNVM